MILAPTWQNRRAKISLVPMLSMSCKDTITMECLVGQQNAEGHVASDGVMSP